MTERSGPEGRALKLTLIATFLSALGVAGARRGWSDRFPNVLELGLMGMAAHRIGRMVAFEGVAEPIRAPFTATVPDDSGADDTVVAQGRGVRWVLGELMSCPTCVATWAALGLSIGRLILPGPTRFAVQVLGIAEVAELNYVAVEHLEWSSRAARRRSA